MAAVVAVAVVRRSTAMAGHVLDSGVRLSQARVWDLEKEFYVGGGADVWKDELVPSLATASSAGALDFCRAFAAFVEDRTGCFVGPCVSDYTGSGFVILEMGSGVGKFAFLFLLHLQELAEQAECPRLLDPTFVQYVMTDVSRDNIEALSRQPQLRAFREKGILRQPIIFVGQFAGQPGGTSFALAGAAKRR